MLPPKRPLDQGPHFVPCKTGDVLTDEQLAKLFPGNRALFVKDIMALGQEAFAHTRSQSSTPSEVA